MIAAAQKIKSLEEVACQLDALRATGKKTVHCHGVFDLLHIGHLRHLNGARRLGDILVVTITPDHLVNKGPGRPAAHQLSRPDRVFRNANHVEAGVASQPGIHRGIQPILPFDGNRSRANAGKPALGQ